MNERLGPGKSAALLSLMARHCAAAPGRANRPAVELLESRTLLATVAEFLVPSGIGAVPSSITNGPGGSIWFTEQGADRIGSIDPVTHVPVDYDVSTPAQPNPQPFGIALGPDGNIWFTEIGANQIAKMNPTTHEITSFGPLATNAVPWGITAGPNNTIWFTEKAANQIGKVDISTGKVTEYPITTANNSVPEGITLGPDGNIWFTESLGNAIAMYDTTNHTFIEHALPTPGAQPYGITAGPNGKLWFTEYSGNQIGWYDTNSSAAPVEIKIPTSGTEPAQIVFGPDGNVWFTQHGTSQVGRFNPPSASFTEYGLGTQSGPVGIMARNDGTIWFAEGNSGKVGAVTSTHIVVTSPPPGGIKPGEAFGLTVAVQFDSGAVVTGYNGIVNLGGLAAGSLSGTTSVTAVNGVATFDGLSLIGPGTYSIEVTSGSVAPQMLNPINVTAPVPVPTPGPAPVPLPPVVIGERLVMAGKGKNQYVAGIVVTFSAALDPATAQNASNYVVTQMTKGGRSRIAKAIRVRAIYDPTLNSVRLTFGGKPRFNTGGRLALNASGISGANGMHLQGNTGSYVGANGMYVIRRNGRGVVG